MTKKCFRCNKEKKIESFYVHKYTADGHLGKCKICTRRDTAKRYNDPAYKEKIREYERKRTQQPERRRKRKVYELVKREKFPGKYKVRSRTSKAIKSGRLVRMPCQVCGSQKSEAHHLDYRSYMKIKWLCLTHHREDHAKKT